MGKQKTIKADVIVIIGSSQTAVAVSNEKAWSRRRICIITLHHFGPRGQSCDKRAKLNLGYVAVLLSSKKNYLQ